MIDYQALIRGGIEALLIIAVFFLAKKSGKQSAVIEQISKTIGMKDEYNKISDKNKQEMEDDIATFKKNQSETDYNTASDAQLLALHEGRPRTDSSGSGSESQESSKDTATKPSK